MEVCLCSREVEKLKRLRSGARRGVVVEIELALALWAFVDALVKMLGAFVSRRILCGRSLCSKHRELSPEIPSHRYMKWI
jgi:hypothetical protein